MKCYLFRSRSSNSRKVVMALATLALLGLQVADVAAQKPALPFTESLTLVSSVSGVNTYAGTMTHLGRIVAVVYPDLTFTKYAANGDTVLGFATFSSPTTGTVTFTGGTGRFQGVTGVGDFVISIDPKTGAVHVDIQGTMSY
jgi:hypothetical protein